MGATGAGWVGGGIRVRAGATTSCASGLAGCATMSCTAALAGWDTMAAGWVITLTAGAAAVSMGAISIDDGGANAGASPKGSRASPTRSAADRRLDDMSSNKANSRTTTRMPGRKYALPYRVGH